MNPTALTFEADDKLSLKEFCDRFERYLLVEHDFVEGSLVVSLNAPFGAGKTTFLSMWKSDIEKRRQSDPSLPKGVIVNAWDSDYCGDPLLSLIDTLIKAAGAETNELGAQRLREAAKDVGWFLLGLANSVTSHLSGIDPAEAAKLAEEKKKGRDVKVPDFITLYEQRAKALNHLKQTLSSVFGGDQPKVFLLIDELDRCRPDYAISYLETIKHVFNIHGLVFVLAVDQAQLQCSSKALFGADLNFPEYFRKFAHRTVSLPKPDNAKLLTLTEYYFRNFLNRQNKRTAMVNFNRTAAEHLIQVVRALQMTPRQLQESFRITGHASARKPETQGQMFFCLGVGLMFMAALKVADAVMYERIGKNEISLVEIGKFFTERLKVEDPEWWFSRYVTGLVRSEEDHHEKIGRAFTDLGFVKSGSQFNAEARLGPHVRSWGSLARDRWQQLYEIIETANSFQTG
jgi:hypothetical protein